MKICNDNVLAKAAKLPLFQGLPVAAVEGLVKALDGHVRSFGPGEVVAHEGSEAKALMVVLSGRLRVEECGLRDGERHLVEWLEPGGVFGIALPALGLATYPGMAVAAEETGVLCLEAAAIRRLLEEAREPRLAANLYRLACRQEACVWRKMRILSAYETSDRVLLYLHGRQEDGLPAEVRFRYAELAEYLGVNRTALYRAMARLQRRRQVEICGNVLRLVQK